jgi:hypothetical protein
VRQHEGLRDAEVGRRARHDLRRGRGVAEIGLDEDRDRAESVDLVDEAADVRGAAAELAVAVAARRRHERKPPAVGGEAGRDRVGDAGGAADACHDGDAIRAH